MPNVQPVRHDPTISQPPKLYCQNSAGNCRLIREYILYVTCALCTDCLETVITSSHYSHIESYFHYSWTARLSIIVIPNIVGTAASLGGKNLGLLITIIPSVVRTAVSLGGEGLSRNWIVER